MQRVSKIYKESMKSPLRERSHIMLSFGLINQEAQAKAKLKNPKLASYSNISNIFDKNADYILYATMEENLIKTDGSLVFLPKNLTGQAVGAGFVSRNLISHEPCVVLVDLNSENSNFKGLSIDFGENYPVDFDVISSTGQRISVTNNLDSQWATEEVLGNTSYITVVVNKMRNINNRLRIRSIQFGYGLVYRNQSVADAVLDYYVSPIGADVPQIDFVVNLHNYDRYFNVDNPNSAINYLETGQEMDISFGYELPNSNGKIEWIQGGHLLCSAWESDDSIATIRCQDVFRNMDSEYAKGKYSEVGRSYFDLVTEVMADAGVKKYYIDPRLKNLKTKMPLPRTKHKEILQIIANACRCTLLQSRFGEIQIKSYFIPEAKASSNGELPYSLVANVVKAELKSEYAEFLNNYIKADGKTIFKPKKSLDFLKSTGFVSASVSEPDGTFKINPVLKFKLDGTRAYNGIKLVFGNAVPSEFIVRSYIQGVIVNEYLVSGEEIQKSTVLIRRFDDCNEIQIEFTKMEYGNSRAVLNFFNLDDVADFKITKSDMTSSPKAIKQELVKEIVVPYYIYQKSLTQEVLVYQNVEAIAGATETYYIQEPSYGFSAILEFSSSNVEIIESGNFYVVVKFKVTGTYKLEINGYRYKIIEKLVKKQLSPKGKTIKWKNPLIDNGMMAYQLANWLVDHYKSAIEYEYETRGNPELDVTDIIYQENDFYKNMRVNVYKHRVQFNQSISGKITARRVRG